MVPLKAVTEDGTAYDIEPMKLEVVGDIVGPDFPTTNVGPYVNATVPCVWVELEK